MICFLAIFTLINQTILAQSACMTISYEADYHYYQLHGSNTSNRINQIVSEVEQIYKNSGIDLNFTIVSSNIIKSSIYDTYGISSIYNKIQDVWSTFRNKGYANGSADVALLFSGKKLSNHGVAAGGGACSANSYAVGICVNKNQGYRLTIQQEAQIHAHEIGHLLSDISHDTDSSIMNESTPYVGATKFNASRINKIKSTIRSKTCLSCGSGTINPPVVNNNCSLNVSNPTACEFYFTVNNITYILPPFVNYNFTVTNGASFSLLYTNWNNIESRTINCNSSNYSIPTNLCGGSIISNSCSSPSFLNANSVSATGCNLNWNNGNGASSYVLYQLINSSWFKLTDVFGTSVGLGLSPGSTYTFAVESVCGTSNSGRYTQTTVQTPNFRTSDNQIVNSGNNNEVFIIDDSLMDINIENNLNIYPNPMKNIGNIDYALDADSKVNLSVTDAMGKEVLSLINEHKPKGKHSIKFETNHLPEGVYFCKIKSGDFVQIQKLMIVK